MTFCVLEKSRKQKIFAILLSVLMIMLVPAIGFAQDTNATPAPKTPVLSPLSVQLKSILATHLMSVEKEASAQRVEGIATYYRSNNFLPIWIENNQISNKARDTLAILANAAEHGLNPRDYDVAALTLSLDSTDLDGLANFEMHLSRSVVAYAQHLNAGRLDPNKVNREIVVFPKAISAENILEKLHNTGNVQIYLRLLAPHTPRYERLKVALEDYKRIAKSGGWTTIPKGEVLKPDMEDVRINQVRARMIEDGSLDKNFALGDRYDENVVAAVKKFQAHLGIEPDGVIGPQTLAQMNVPVKNRIRTMVLNLERRRWMQNKYGRYYIFANLADQVIKLVRDGKTLHAELIQVGQPYHRTPVFSQTMKYVEINPYWNVPYSIATKEYLPKLKANPGALTRQNIQVIADGKIVNPFSVPWNTYSRRNFPVRLRQDSGPKNALGRVKFMFPNKFNVYIHDTPAKSKFNKASRYFSHGCLRLKDPLTLAQYILKPQGYTRKKIERIVKSGKRTIVKLKQNIPVYVTYLTSWVNKDGSVHFRRDIYGRDKILDLALRKASTR